MSEESLREFLARLNGDASFRESAHQNPQSAFAEFGLSPAERIALTSSDEDALRRLAGADVQGYLLNLGGFGLAGDTAENCPHTPGHDCPQTNQTECQASVCDLCASPARRLIR